MIEVDPEIEAKPVAYEYDPKELVNRFRILAEKAIRKCHITPQERHKIMNMYETCMRGYTYFKKE